MFGKLTRKECNSLYLECLQKKEAHNLRKLCREDLFFLLRVACKRVDIDNDWLFDRCREAESDSDNILDLWAREHYKSTIKTFGQTIQIILQSHGDDPDPFYEGKESTTGIFSHTRPIAKAFLAQIKREFEVNTFLQGLFPDILYKDPQKESPQWSLDTGIVVKRRSNPKEATVEAWGLVDGQPTSKHFFDLNYDDVVTRESVNTPEMIQKTTEGWALSLNLGAQGGIKRYSGTRYHANDTYAEMIRRGAVTERKYPATEDGTIHGKPVLFTPAQLREKYEAMGSYIFSCQMLQNPLADNVMGFKDEWLNYYDYLRNCDNWIYILLCDPAGEKKNKVSFDPDYTVQVVIALGTDGNYYLVDGKRARMNLTERTQSLIALHRKWKPLKVGYEKYGKDADIEHIMHVQQQEGYRFNIIPLGGGMAKNDRIRRLVPIFEQNRFWIPRTLHYKYPDGTVKDFIKELVEEEYDTFPVSKHDDMLDCIARILDDDLQVSFPKKTEKVPLPIIRATNIQEYDVLSSQPVRI